MQGANELDGKAASLVPGVSTVNQACESKAFVDFLESVIKTANKNGAVCPSNAARIAKFTILPPDFFVETEELTATLKLRRNVVEKKYLLAIDAIYESTEGDGAMFVPFKM